MRHWQPVRAIYKIASSTARKLVSRGRPNALRAGMEGSITAHSASVRSLAYRCPARSYFGRVISVQMLYLGDCSTQPLCYNHLKSLNSFPVSLLVLILRDKLVSPRLERRSAGSLALIILLVLAKFMTLLFLQKIANKVGLRIAKTNSDAP